MVLIVTFHSCFSSQVAIFHPTDSEEFEALKKIYSRGSSSLRKLPTENCSMKLKPNTLSSNCLYEQGIKQLANKCFIKALDYFILYFSNNKFSLDDVCDVNRVPYDSSGFNSPENDNLVEIMRSMPFVLTNYKSKQDYEKFFINLPVIVKSNSHFDHLNNFKRFHSLMIVQLLITNNQSGIDKQSPLAQCINDFSDEHSEDINCVLLLRNDATLKKLEVTSRNWQCR